MSKLPLVFILTILSLLWNGCCETCEPDYRIVQLRLMRNGVNAVFGDNAILERDDIRTYNQSFHETERRVIYKEDDQAIWITVDQDFPLILEMGIINQDTFSITLEPMIIEECCTYYRTSSVIMNGEVICTVGECDEVFEIEI